MKDVRVQSKRDRRGLTDSGVKLYKRDFWSKENRKYAEPHFRMRKVAHTVSRLAEGRQCNLLDVGCGPAALQQVLPANVHYYGIDIAISEPADNLLERDIVEAPIDFGGRRFDFVVAQGMFEYVGAHQDQKFAEIAELLGPDGKFVLTYQNFGHWQREVYWPYSNVQLPADFRKCIARFFRIERRFPASHNWYHSQPRRGFMQSSQAHLNINVPVISPILAVDYLYVCSPLRPRAR